MNPLLKVAVDAARAGAKVLLQSMDRIDRLDIKEKAPLDYVSSADHQAEAAVLEILQKFYPNYSILAEESGDIVGSESTYCWVVDPLDGTTNFLKSIPHFAISIALLKNGHPIHAVVYDPVRDELFTASKGMGAFCNSMRLRVQRKQRTVKGAYMALGGPLPSHQDTWFKQVDAMQALLQRLSGFRRLGAASLDMCYVAAGRVDGYWGNHLKPWDFRAAELIVKEAGGFVTDHDGQTHYVDDGNVLAAEPKLLHQLVTLLAQAKTTKTEES